MTISLCWEGGEEAAAAAAEEERVSTRKTRPYPHHEL